MQDRFKDLCALKFGRVCGITMNILPQTKLICDVSLFFLEYSSDISLFGEFLANESYKFY